MEPIVEDMTVDKSARHGNIGPLLVPGTWDAVFWVLGTRKLISHLHGVIPIRPLPTPPGKSSYNVSRRFGIRVDLVVRPDGDQSFPPEIRAYTPGTAYHGTIQGQIQYRSEEIRATNCRVSSAWDLITSGSHRHPIHGNVQDSRSVVVVSWWGAPLAARSCA